ncbi:hypothetical protein Enr13x_48590 [Stieleria neptunia]|uniref:Uncharacterized protein n=1 Tax=Stieleria neptunia TaxID=2527979 RepID=A0A518HVV6_9BACT|nr:hypothetical protein Enr13x_48590 [Stieleria neptunia]
MRQDACPGGSRIIYGQWIQESGDSSFPETWPRRRPAGPPNPWCSWALTVSAETDRDRPANKKSLLLNAKGLSSYPARVSPAAENTGQNRGGDENTTESTTPAAMVSECIREHLDDAQLDDLLEQLRVRST